MLTPWPHQVRTVQATLAAIDRGERRLCVTIPTGGGKTLVITDLARRYLSLAKKVILYSNRKMLVEQTSEVLMEAGLYHGVRAAGYEDEREHPFQVSSIQTEHARVMRGKSWDLHLADLVLVDEGHLQGGEAAREIFNAHYEAGAVLVFFTASPFDMADLCDLLIVGAKTSELRACGALVPAYHYGPDEPDFKAFSKLRRALENGEQPSEAEVAKLMPAPKIFGRVLEWFNKLNPERKATLCFCADVGGSKWTAERFCANGIPAAHIDGNDVWFKGELRPSNRELRQEVLNASRSGEIVVICNRFVLREGINCPWLRHGIFATTFGLQSYIQSGGRLLRADPGSGKEHVTIQDHGGNWWRHGSLNADREWSLDLTPSMVAGLRADRFRRKQQREPFLCPECQCVLSTRRCPCGWTVPQGFKPIRPVMSTEGVLKEMSGDIFKPRSICKRNDGPSRWERMYWRSRTQKGRRTFRAAMALFAEENYWQWPDPTWPFMPVRELDFYQFVSDVPRERLVQKETAGMAAGVVHGS